MRSAEPGSRVETFANSVGGVNRNATDLQLGNLGRPVISLAAKEINAKAQGREGESKTSFAAEQVTGGTADQGTQFIRCQLPLESIPFSSRCLNYPKLHRPARCVKSIFPPFFTDEVDVESQKSMHFSIETRIERYH